MSKDTGGPAFPVSYDHQTFEPSHVDEAKRLMSGMTLRDYFAARALQGLCADPNTADSTRENLVAECYELADAMLAARVKP
ncbi:hypothetical protein [Pseudomonas monteilii]|uniref:hypothetical protein n=1 Tax=Pseudomonas monteilii TaxID=76759 RepID=UPI0018A9B218|nr:hypothetical protein [Pseudomonas monteilii]MBF8746864.1 hypothetical protein [Pseudomonas monteilii]